MKRRQAMILGLALVALAGCATKPAMNEVEVENIAVKLAGDTQKGQYRPVTAEPLKGWLDAGKPMLIVDTMPVRVGRSAALEPRLEKRASVRLGDIATWRRGPD